MSITTTDYWPTGPRPNRWSLVSHTVSVRPLRKQKRVTTPMGSLNSLDLCEVMLYASLNSFSFRCFVWSHLRKYEKSVLNDLIIFQWAEMTMACLIEYVWRLKLQLVLGFCLFFRNFILNAILILSVNSAAYIIWHK